MFKEVGDVGLTFDEEDDDLEVNCLRKRWSSSRSHNKDCQDRVKSSRKKPKSSKNARSIVNDAYKKEMIACLNIDRWFYDARIPFNACKYDSFGPMVDAIGTKQTKFHVSNVQSIKNFKKT